MQVLMCKHLKQLLLLYSYCVPHTKSHPHCHPLRRPHCVTHCATHTAHSYCVTLPASPHQHCVTHCATHTASPSLRHPHCVNHCATHTASPSLHRQLQDLQRNTGDTLCIPILSDGCTTSVMQHLLHIAKQKLRVELENPDRRLQSALQCLLKP